MVGSIALGERRALRVELIDLALETCLVDLGIDRWRRNERRLEVLDLLVDRDEPTMRPTLDPMLPANLLQAREAHSKRDRDLLRGKLPGGARDMSASCLHAHTNAQVVTGDGRASAHTCRGVHGWMGRGEGVKAYVKVLLQLLAGYGLGHAAGPHRGRSRRLQEREQERLSL